MPTLTCKGKKNSDFTQLHTRLPDWSQQSILTSIIWADIRNRKLSSSSTFSDCDKYGIRVYMSYTRVLTTVDWHTSNIRVHTTDIRVAHGVRVHTTDIYTKHKTGIRLTYGYIRLHTKHTNDIRVTHGYKPQTESH